MDLRVFYFEIFILSNNKNFTNYHVVDFSKIQATTLFVCGRIVPLVVRKNGLNPYSVHPYYLLILVFFNL